MKAILQGGRPILKSECGNVQPHQKITLGGQQQCKTKGERERILRLKRGLGVKAGRLLINTIERRGACPKARAVRAAGGQVGGGGVLSWCCVGGDLM